MTREQFEIRKQEYIAHLADGLITQDEFIRKIQELDRQVLSRYQPIAIMIFLDK